MRPNIAAANPPSTALEYLEEEVYRPGRHWGARDGMERLWASVPSAWRLLGIAILGALAAGGVGWAAAANPGAAPAHVAVLVRVLIIATLIGTGIYAQKSKIQTRMGGQLVAVGFFTALWLLNGSSNRVLFSIGVLCSVVAPVAFAFLMLSYPWGRLRSLAERRFIWGIGAGATILWIVAVVIARQPPLTTSLVKCGPHCPDNVFSLGSATSTPGALKAPLVLAWLAITCGTPLLLSRHLRAASGPLRRALVPVLSLSAANAVLLVAYLVSRAAGLAEATGLATAYVVVTAAVPLGLLVGLSMERMLIARALADLVTQLGRQPDADPEALLSSTLGDRSLRIAYERSVPGTYVDSSGAPLNGLPDDQAITWVERDRRSVAAVMYSHDLAGQERLVEAAGAVALMRLETVRLEADLRASTAELAASRVRIAETAHNERQRLERDLHDGVQQQLVGVRIKLDLAADVMREDPVKAQSVLASLGRQMDDALKALRMVAHGIYPELLHDRGLTEALRAAARGTPVPTLFRATGIGRYAEQVELAVYYCCLEALQNSVKHARSDDPPTLTLWRLGPTLCFEVRDSGVGFDTNQTSSGVGLINMHDRIQTVGGTIEISSGSDAGTSVRGRVPIV